MVDVVSGYGDGPQVCPDKAQMHSQQTFYITL